MVSCTRDVYHPDKNIEVRINKDLGLVTYYVKNDVAISKLDSRIGLSREIKYKERNIVFDGANVDIDSVSSWFNSFKDITFIRTSLKWNNIQLPNVNSLGYYPINYNNAFYEIFPNVETLSVYAKTFDSMDFLYKLPRLKTMVIGTDEKSQEKLSSYFVALADFLQSDKNRLEGFVDFTTPYHYPLNNSIEGIAQYYADPPIWYHGPDISGIPAWTNDNNVKFTREPSGNSRILKLLRKGQFVIIKGLAEKGQFDKVWKNNDDYQKDQDGDEKTWIKVRMVDRSEGYIFGPYLTLNNPRVVQ